MHVCEQYVQKKLDACVGTIVWYLIMKKNNKQLFYPIFVCYSVVLHCSIYDH